MSARSEETTSATPGAWDFEFAIAPLRDVPFALQQAPTPVDSAHVLTGHIHPAAECTDRSPERLRMPFLMLDRRPTVLLAFGEVTGTAVVRPRRDERVVCIAPHGEWLDGRASRRRSSEDRMARHKTAPQQRTETTRRRTWKQ